MNITVYYKSPHDFMGGEMVEVPTRFTAVDYAYKLAHYVSLGIPIVVRELDKTYLVNGWLKHELIPPKVKPTYHQRWQHASRLVREGLLPSTTTNTRTNTQKF